MSIFRKRPRAGVRHGLTFAGPNHRARLRRQPCEIGHMIIMGVGDEDVPHRETLGRNYIKHRAAICPRVKRRRQTRARVPHKITVHGHVFEPCAKHRKPARKNRLPRPPPRVRQILQRVGVEPQMPRDAPQHGVNRSPGFDSREILCRHLCCPTQLGVGDFPAALGLANHISKIVFKRNERHTVSQPTPPPAATGKA
jgi:hypothetical protein